MPWSNTPGQRIPERIRRQVLARDSHRCTHLEHGTRCTARAVEIDHVVPRHQGGTDDPANLTSLCRPHHRAKTQTEAAAARWRHRAKREPEPHPGLVARGRTPSPG